MKNKQAKIKTYISEANQNRISDTLSVAGKDEMPSQTQQTDVPSSVHTQTGDLAKDEVELVNEESDEPESLSAETENLPPNAASADAEAVAGIPVGGVHGQEGDIK